MWVLQRDYPGGIVLWQHAPCVAKAMLLAVISSTFFS